MNQRIAALGQVLLATICFTGIAAAFDTDQVTITAVNSFDSHGHLWVSISGNSDCPTPSPYFIVQRWDNQDEATKAVRQQMYQLALVAFASGKSVRVYGSSCYLDKYLYAEQIVISD